MASSEIVGGQLCQRNIARAFLAKKVCPVVFHTPTTHGTDLVSSSESELVVQTMVSMVRPGGVAIASKPATVKKGDVTVTCQILGGAPLVVITKSPVPTEDLPQEVHDACMKKLVERGILMVLWWMPITPWKRTIYHLARRTSKI